MKALISVVAVLLSFSTVVGASVITQNFDFSQSGYVEDTVADNVRSQISPTTHIDFDLFDASLGTLSSVELIFQSSMVLNYGFSIDSPDLNTIGYALGGSTVISFDVPVYDPDLGAGVPLGVNVGLGLAGSTSRCFRVSSVPCVRDSTYNINQTRDYLIDSISELDAFTGVGTFGGDFGMMLRSEIGSLGAGDSGLVYAEGLLNGSGTLVFNYDARVASVPSPNTFWLLFPALLVLFMVRRKQTT